MVLGEVGDLVVVQHIEVCRPLAMILASLHSSSPILTLMHDH